jgi:predicted TIM-barrel fold metal-dependent hydrolase
MTNDSSSDPLRFSRRAFHRGFLAAAGACAMTGLSSPLNARAEEAKFPPGKYVDMHVHLGQPWNERGPLTAEMMLRWMDYRQISQACVLPLISPESWFYPITPDWVLEQTRPFRDRLIPFCSVDPRTVNLGGKKGYVDILKRYVDAGAKGFGEHKWGGRMDDPRNIELFQACGELGLLVLFHMDNTRNVDSPGLPGLEKVLREVPNVDFVGHAPGFWNSISGDVRQEQMESYPRTPVAPGGALDRLFAAHSNLYGELSAGSGANAIARDKEFGRDFLIRNADRLMFGTDYLADKQEVPQFELLDELKLPEETASKIFRDNARKLLKLS